MGCNTRERSIRGGRRARHAAKLPAPPPPPRSVAAAAASSPSPDADPSAPIPVNPTLELNLNPNPNPNPSVGLEDAGWGYCTEDQLEELLLKNLDAVYKEALSRLVSLGYDEPVALRSILCNGHCYGNLDALSNIMHNTIAHLTALPNPNPNPNSNPNPTPSGFTDLRNLEEYSLAGMVCLLQQIRPHLTRGDAMWCLLMSELHVGRAAAIDLPGLHPTLCRPFPRRITNPNSSLDTDVVASVMKSLESMSIEEDKVPAPEEDRKKEMILELIKQIRDLEMQVKDRKEWAQQKAMQAARKLSNDLAELKLLRMEREENQWGKKGKAQEQEQEPEQEDPAAKQLAEMEAELKKASGQVDRANAVVRRLETENAEIRAEMEASKLSASESAKICQELTKKERKCLKRLAAWEKQKAKMLEEVAEERRKISQVQQQLKEVHEGQKETEMKWRQTIKDKEQAILQVEEERRAKEAAEINAKRKQEALRQKIEIDFQRHKDDIRRLEEELSRLEAAAGSSQLSSPASNALDGYTETTSKQPKEASARMIQGPSKPQESSRKISRHRECIICMQEEVSVVFLPCAHQVVCAACNLDHEKRGKSCCPCCNVQIEERIHVYGTSY